jgi:hypothetical protein
VDRVSWRRLLAVTLAVGACTKQGPQRAVCGLHSASKPVTLGGKPLSVGARLMPADRVSAQGAALLECFGGALKVLDGDTVTVGELTEARVEATTVPRFVLRNGAPVKVDVPAPAVVARYSDNRFTPETAFAADDGPTTNDYFRAFFTPHGIENMGSAPRPDGPTKLAPPSARTPVSRIHAGELGEGGATLQVTDEVVFAETDGLATAALPEGKVYALGATTRLVLPDDAEATLRLPGLSEINLEGPMDLKLR